MSWSPPSCNGGVEVSLYQLEVSNGGANSYSLIAAGNTLLLYNHTGLVHSSGYDFRVKVNNTCGTSPYSQRAESTLFATQPSAPTKPTLVEQGKRYLTVSWNAPSNDNGAAIFQYIINVNGATFSHTNLDSLVYNITSLSVCSTYTVKVIARNSVGFGPYGTSNTLFTIGTLPAAPGSIVATGNTIDSVSFKWTLVDACNLNIIKTHLTISPASSPLPYDGQVLSKTINPVSGYNDFNVAFENECGLGPATGNSNMSVNFANMYLISNTLNSIEFGWDKEGGFANQILTYHKISRDSDIIEPSYSAAANSYNNTGLVSCTSYAFILESCTSDGCGYATKSFKSGGTISSSPIFFADNVVSKSYTSIEVKWDAPVTIGGANIQFYEVYAQLLSTYDDGSSPDYSQLLIYNGTSTSYLFDGLRASSTYGFKMRAKNLCGYSNYYPSDTLFEYRTVPVTVPDTPAPVTVVSKTISSLEVEWLLPELNGAPLNKYNLVISGQTVCCDFFDTRTNFNITSLVTCTQYVIDLTVNNTLGSPGNSVGGISLASSHITNTDCDCNSGYYSTDCSKECPGGAVNPCFSKGVCFDGSNGNGTCSCNINYGGLDCNEEFITDLQIIIPNADLFIEDEIEFSASMNTGTNILFTWTIDNTIYTDQSINHIFIEAGNYTVNLNATNSISNIIIERDLEIKDLSVLSIGNNNSFIFGFSLFIFILLF